MRSFIVLISTAALAACGGGMGASTVGSAGSVATGSGTGTATPDKYAEFASATSVHSYTGVGGTQTYSYKSNDADPAQYGQLYQGNASRLADNSVTITYDPRDAIFSLTVKDSKSGSDILTRFQDPAHRTLVPYSTPELTDVHNANVRYLSVGTSTGSAFTPGFTVDETSMFYEVPGSTTKYVGYAGYVRTQITTASQEAGQPGTIVDSTRIDRGAFAFGVLTDSANVPTSGTATYTGAMLATMINTPGDALYGASYTQWLHGTSSSVINFGTGKVDLSLQGLVSTTSTDFIHITPPEQPPYVPDGSLFSAVGTGNLLTSFTKGFTGSFTDVKFTTPGGGLIEHFTPPVSPADKVNVRALPDIVLAASTFDGNFYGPKGEEVGGGFRIIGGTPDQRVDILGAFTGKKP